MSIRSQFGGVVAGVVVCLIAASAGWAQQDAASLWGDFNHYVLVARPDLAQAAATQLLETVEGSALLDVVEASDYADYDRTLQRAQRIEALGEVAKKLDAKIQAARIERSREPKRIDNNIQLLAQGQRPYRNAVVRLKGAGQYAAPQLLAVLRDSDQAKLHPYIMQAMVAVGRPLVAPLSEALPQLDAVTQRRVAQVLAEVGYPHPLAYLKQILEDSTTDADARNVADRAFDRLIERTALPRDLTAASLYLLLGQSQYHHAQKLQSLAGYDPATDEGVIWHYGPKIGLVAVHVPGAIYGDVLAMVSARKAMTLDPSLDQALSLYLMANLRRENNLPEGQADPSYGTQQQDPMFYALLAGPDRLQDVLAMALAKNDAALAIDAIDALSQTAGIKDQLARSRDARPLLTALSFPDRRVRFRAAAALASAGPNEAFEGSFRVVPVLGEALRPSDTKVALVIADDQTLVNDLAAVLDDLGYDVIGGLSLDETSAAVASASAVDVILVSGSVEKVENVLSRTQTDYRLGAVPILAVLTPAQQIDLNEHHGDEARLTSTLLAAEVEALTDAIDRSLAILEPQTLSEEQVTDQAYQSLRLLANVARASDVYRVEDAMDSLIAVLGGSNDAIVNGGGVVLSMIDRAEAQSAIAEAVFDNAVDVQISLLDSLANSATRFGNHLSADQTDRLLKLVFTSTGDTALAAARAHGALALPTSNSVQQILGAK